MIRQFPLQQVVSSSANDLASSGYRIYVALDVVLPPKSKLKKRRFDRHDDIKVIRDLPLSRNLPLKSPDDWYMRNVKTAFKN